MKVDLRLFSHRFSQEDEDGFTATMAGTLKDA
jgi:hypothetical protein